MILYLRFSNEEMMSTKATLSLEEKIDRAKDGRSQTWIVEQMIKKGCPISDVQFSRKKKGREDFKPDELIALSEILSIEL